MTDVTFTITCWCCGAQTDVVASAYPQFAFELATAACAVGWLGVIDHYRSRTVVLCSDACLERCKTAKGTLRARPPRAA